MAKVATIKIEFPFCAAHYLPYNKGECRHMHGHNFTLTVYVKGEVNRALKDEKLSNDGMVMEFDKIKLIVKERVIDVLDHRCLNDKLWGDHLPPTTENTAYWIFQQLYNLMPLYMILLQETPRNSVIVEYSDFIKWLKEEEEMELPIDRL